ncbi:MULTISPECIES: coiled-coil domain-containing protein [Nocardiopsis]|uniref:Response regulator receiver protein n=1 Tax=Nocardiopsis sinuspersici TaxID=501010 RepID=A0A1V3BVI9_9ACTN|nr:MULTISPECIES: hypothetical protein [Nocardiopsis]OOC52418.1 hypothetical protein NOSIN_00035 [Nocardiopsis sinuspersici]
MDHEPAPLAPALSGDLCGLSQCRRPLPARIGRGPRYEYCQDRTWDYDGKALTCRELGDAEKKWTTVFGRAPADTVLADLRAAVATARDPLGDLTAVLERVSTEVGEHADTALAEAAQARAAAAEAEGRAQTAETATDAARLAQQKAETDRDTAQTQAREAERVADRARREATSDRESAAVARGAAERLEQETERLRAEAAELQGQANAAAAQAERAQAQHQAAAEERDRLRTQLDTERREGAAERTRLTAQTERLSTDYAVRLDELQQAHTDAQDRAARAHAEQVADLQRKAGRGELLAEQHTQLQEQCQLLRLDRGDARRGLQMAVRALDAGQPSQQVRDILQRHLDQAEPAAQDTGSTSTDDAFVPPTGEERRS